MTCQRCNGLCVTDYERDQLEGVDLEVTRCIQCGARSYQPTYHPPIAVTKGEYYPQRGC